MTEERYESFTESHPRLAATLSGSFSVYDSQESDDFVVIDLVSSAKETSSLVSSSPEATAPSSPASPSEAKKEVEYDDYVELFIDDANVSRALYRLPAVVRLNEGRDNG